MRKTLSILLIAVFLFGAGQGSTTDSTANEKTRVVETPKQDTEIGELKLRAAKIENEESLMQQKADSVRISK